MRNLVVHPRIEREHVNQAIALDREVFGGETSSAAIRNAERNPWAYTVLTLRGNVEGYGLVLPLDNFGDEALRRGEIDEDRLMLKHVVRPEDASSIYIASIAAKPGAPPWFRSRLVGYTFGSVIRSPKPLLAVAITQNGDSIAREIGMGSQKYSGKFEGVNGYVPMLFTKQEFSFE